MGKYVMTFESYSNVKLSDKVEAAFKAYVAEDKRLRCEFKGDNDDEDAHTESPFIICTNGAIWVRDTFFPTAVVMGYHHDDNPTAEIGETEGGHDFLVLDNRYIIDFWYRDLYDNDAPILVDMETEPDLVSRYYGDPATWEESGQPLD